MTYTHKIYHRSFLFKLVYVLDVPLFIFFDFAIILMYYNDALNIFEAILGFCFITALLLYFLNGLVYTVNISDKEISINRLFKRREVINLFDTKKELELVHNRNSSVTAFDLIITDQFNKQHSMKYVTRKLIDHFMIKGYEIPNHHIVKKKYFL